MTGNDPTDQALAVIASIFEKPAPKPDAKAHDERGVESERGESEADESERRHQSFEPSEASVESDAELVAGDSDIAITAPELLPDGVTSVRIEREIVEITVTSASEESAPVANIDVGAHQPIAPEDEDLDSFTRHGPGPLEALRFKWSVRRDDDGYYVDETIGTTSHPITAGPLSRADAISFVQTRERRTHRRFERLRNEILTGPSERGVEDDDDETL